MCGISGIIKQEKDLGAHELETLARNMSDIIAHRGPDSSGYWTDVEAGLAFSHRRLAILDLSAEGHQPMMSSDERFVIVFNGEIYNFKEIKSQLETLQHQFRGHSDTEVLLAAIQHWGLEKTLQSIRGMFAFALWDRKDRKLSLARDHLGKKPLYFGHVGNDFVFGSELKSFTVLKGFKKNLNRNVLSTYMRHNYIPAPWSIYDGIFKLVPGGFVTLDFTTPVVGGNSLLDQVNRYWSAHHEAHRGQDELFSGSFEDATDILDQKLQDAVAQRMVADVPLGAFLSGGIDSSLIVALMQKQSSNKVKTYAIGFEEADFDETQHATAVAEHLGTDHTTFTVRGDETRDVIPSLADVYDEPFADMSQIPTMHVCRLARQSTTVALSGDGGDESFGGYTRYRDAEFLANKVLTKPSIVKKAMGSGIHLLPASMWDSLLLPFQDALHKVTGRNITGHALYAAADFLDSNDYNELYLNFISHWKNPGKIIKGTSEVLSPMTDPSLTPQLDSHVHTSMLYDTMAYLPDDILVKVDRASMAHSLEVRAPLLDKEVIEWAWTLPLHYKYENGDGKRILKSLLNRYVPSEITDRPKQGFGVPMAAWLRGSLREWAEDLLSEDALKRHELFEVKPIRQMWQQHLSGKRDWNYYLWDVLMAQAWAERWKIN